MYSRSRLLTDRDGGGGFTLGAGSALGAGSGSITQDLRSKLSDLKRPAQ